MNGDNACPVLGNVLENGLRQIKVLQGMLTPSIIVIQKLIVGWAEVGSSDNDRVGEEPLLVVIALDFIAISSAETIIEHHSVENHFVGTITLAI